jgi:hypothetical protein
MMDNPLLSQLPRCEACGEVELHLRYGLDERELDFSEPVSWALVPLQATMPIEAGGIHPASVCTSCGRIADLQTDRAVIWNVERSGSAVPKLVPPMEQPARAVYDAAEWEDAGACDLYHLACLRGRWADDCELEAIAIGRLLDAERRRYQDQYSDEVRARAHTLLADERSTSSARIELQTELGLDAMERQDPATAHRHLEEALRLTQDDQIQSALRTSGRDASRTPPDVPWLAIDTAEAADRAGEEGRALEILRWAVPRCGERPVQHGGAHLGRRLAAQAGDGDFELACELILLRELVEAWRDDDRHDPVAVQWPAIEALVAADPSGRRQRAAVADVERWFASASRDRLLGHLQANRR